MKKLKELTPKDFKCGIGPCPAVFSTNNSYIIVGKKISAKIKELKGRISKGECAIEVPKDLLVNLH